MVRYLRAKLFNSISCSSLVRLLFQVKFEADEIYLMSNARRKRTLSVSREGIPCFMRVRRISAARNRFGHRSAIISCRMPCRGVNSKSLSARRGFPWSDLCYLSSKFPPRNLAYWPTFDCPSIYGNYPRAGWWSFIIVRRMRTLFKGYRYSMCGDVSVSVYIMKDGRN